MARAKTRVRLTLNMGWIDAETLGLQDASEEELTEGSIVEVLPEHAKTIVARSWGVLIEDERTPREMVKPAREAAASKS